MAQMELASNSLLEACVMAHNAYQEMLIRFPLDKEPQTAPDSPEWESGDLTPPDEAVLIYHSWDEIRRLMWDYVSIVRTDNRLQRAGHRLRNLRNEVRQFYWGHRVDSDILELRNLVTVASLVVDCAVQEKNPRDPLYTGLP